MKILLSSLVRISQKVISFLISLPSNFKKIYSKLADMLGNLKIGRLVNRKSKIVFLIFILVVFLSQIFFGIMVYGFKSEDKFTRIAAKIVPYPIIFVNFSTITYNDYLDEKSYIHHFYEATKQDASNFTEVDKQIVDQLIESKLLEYQALINHVKISRIEIDSTIKEIEDQNGGKDQVKKVLTDLYGLNINQFRALVKAQLLRSKVNDQVISKVKVKHILIRVASDAKADQIEAARVKLVGVKDEIKNGLDFADAAKKYSEDTGSAEQGGDLDYFSKGEMVDEFSDAAFATPVGEISEPVRTEFGWHLIKVESRSGRVDEKFTDWLIGLKKHNFVLKFMN